MALDFLKVHGIAQPSIGKNWITRFLLWHLDLASKFSNRLAKQLAFAGSPKILQDFFDWEKPILRKLIHMLNMHL